MKQIYRRQYNGRWYYSNVGDVRFKKSLAQEEAQKLRKRGLKCVIVKDRLGWRIFKNA